MPPPGMPSSQQGPAPMLGPMAGPQGSQTGPQGAPIGIAAGAARPPHGERNSMNDGRRQPLPPPKQLLQPGAVMTGAPPSQQGAAAAGPQAGSQAGAHAGPHGCIGAMAGAAPPPHGERNSMNDGRRQLEPPPKQLLQPLAVRRPPETIAKQATRDRASRRDMASSPG